MGHHEQGAFVATPPVLQVVGKPADRAHVEVVGGFVEHDDVPVADEDARKVDAAALAARKGAYRGGGIDVAQQLVDDVTGLAVGLPYVGGRARPSEDTLDRVVVGKGVGLPQHAHRGAAAGNDLTAVGLDAPRQNLEEGRLAVAVLAHDADAVAGVHAERHVAEQLLRRVFEPHVFAGEQNRHRCLLTHG